VAKDETTKEQAKPSIEKVLLKDQSKRMQKICLTQKDKNIRRKKWIMSPQAMTKFL
jgi:hypothetical protein